jgi:hypothetical protein
MGSEWRETVGIILGHGWTLDQTKLKKSFAP